MTALIALTAINTLLLILGLCLAHAAKKGDEIRRRMGVR